MLDRKNLTPILPEKPTEVYGKGKRLEQTC